MKVTARVTHRCGRGGWFWGVRVHELGTRIEARHLLNPSAVHAAVALDTEVTSTSAGVAKPGLPALAAAGRCPGRHRAGPASPRRPRPPSVLHLPPMAPFAAVTARLRSTGLLRRCSPTVTTSSSRAAPVADDSWFGTRAGPFSSDGTAPGGGEVLALDAHTRTVERLARVPPGRVTPSYDGSTETWSPSRGATQRLGAAQIPTGPSRTTPRVPTTGRTVELLGEQRWDVEPHESP